jgi:hypothetical protein
MREPDTRIIPISEGLLARRPVLVLYNRVLVSGNPAKQRFFWATDHVRLSGTLLYSILPYEQSPYKGRILPSDILGRRRPVGFCERIFSHRGWNPASDMLAPRPTPTAYRGVNCI